MGWAASFASRLISLDKRASMEPKAKRLRGFRLEQEKAKGRDPLFKGGMAEKPSALGTLLLTLWSHGQLSTWQ